MAYDDEGDTAMSKAFQAGVSRTSGKKKGTKKTKKSKKDGGGGGGGSGLQLGNLLGIHLPAFLGGKSSSKKKKSTVKTPETPTMATPSSYARGGKVRKTGVAKVHKGEVVVTASQARARHKKGKKKSKKGSRKRVTKKE